jgi:hypothetical protein
MYAGRQLGADCGLQSMWKTFSQNEKFSIHLRQNETKQISLDFSSLYMFLSPSAPGPFVQQLKHPLFSEAQSSHLYFFPALFSARKPPL